MKTYKQRVKKNNTCSKNNYLTISSILSKKLILSSRPIANLEITPPIE
jgi:hypothetical protein